MESAESVGLLVAFSAGILSFLSPCVLPLVPSYVSFITGMSLEELTGKPKGALIHATLFIIGFTTIFVALGASASAAGLFLTVNKSVFERVGGVLILIFGLYMFGLLNIGPFARERRIHFKDKPTGYLGSVLVGLAFGAGWTPCIGPVLASILTFTGSQADLSKGIGLLFTYSMGLAVPFFIAAAAVDRFMKWFQVYRKYMPLVNKISGAMLIAVGLLMITGYFSVLAAWLQGLTPDFLRERI
jgi:cytochrome c-type biogenesis protein